MQPATMQRARTLVAAAGLLFAAPLGLMGCPENACFLEICSGKNCRCSISSCGEGAAFDTKQRRCRCVVGYFDVAGQCLDQAQANAYCGPGYGFAPPAAGFSGGCVKLQCRPGDELDLKTGWCISKEQVAAQAGVQLAAGQKLGCAAGEQLVVEGGQPACVPVAQSCAKDEFWSGTACAKQPTCPTGEKFDAALGRCVAYAKGGDELVVDVQQWAYSTFGPPNGPGTPSFCATFAKKPLGFGLSPGSGALVRVTVNLSFPSDEVARAAGQASTVYDTSGNPVPNAGAAEVQSAVSAQVAALAAGGGRASAQQASTTVRCSVVNASKPIVVPESGGF